MQDRPSIQTLISLPQLSDARISPDGHRLAFVIRETDPQSGDDTCVIRLMQRCGKPSVWSEEAHAMAGISPRWAPDGSSLAYLSPSSEGDPVLRIRTGEDDRVVAQVPVGSHSLQWLPSGDALSIVAPSRPVRPAVEPAPWSIFGDDNEEQTNDVFCVDTATGDIRSVMSFRGMVIDSAWRGTGQHLAACVVRSADPADWDTGSLRIATLDGSKNVEFEDERYQQAVWSPDGTLLACVRLSTPTFVSPPILEIRDLNGDAVFVIRMRDETRLIAWTPRGLLALQPHGPSSELFWIDPTSGDGSPALHHAPEGFTLIEGWFGQGCALTDDGALMSAVAYDVQHPGEVALLDLDAGTATYITDKREAVRDWTLPVPERVHWRSSDGVAIEGILVAPHDEDTGGDRALVVVLHGGPTSMASQAALADNDWIWGAIPQLVHRGAFVLFPNYRGSAGYGYAFRSANVGLLGQINADDVASGIRALAATRAIDPSRVAALGASHGGYLAGFLAARGIGLAAAVVRSGISNWALNARLNQNPAWEVQYLGDGPDECPEAYRTTSVTTYVDDSTAPTLILHGDRDTQAPTANAHALYRRLRLCNVPTRMVLYHGMGHGGATRQQITHSLQETLAWLDRWLDLPPRGSC